MNCVALSNFIFWWNFLTYIVEFNSSQGVEIYTFQRLYPLFINALPPESLHVCYLLVRVDGHVASLALLVHVGVGVVGGPFHLAIRTKKESERPPLALVWREPLLFTHLPKRTTQLNYLAKFALCVKTLVAGSTSATRWITNTVCLLHPVHHPPRQTFI